MFLLLLLLQLVLLDAAQHQMHWLALQELGEALVVQSRQ